ncbi:MAG TPA: TSUP family transporter [Tepidisphaeraceae bacterium]|nr:TSUP family transporter [Tepidisphaeraceae bacterium]
MTHPLMLIAFGILVGVFSGLMGLGGGSIMIPIMVLLLGFSQAKAHGMSLMVMCIPVMLPAVIGYFQNGKITRADIWVAAWIALGFALGSYFGAQVAFFVDRYKSGLQITFGLLLIYVAAYTAFGKENVARSLLLAVIVTAVAAAMVFGVRYSDSRNADQTPAPTASRA